VGTEAVAPELAETEFATPEFAGTEFGGAAPAAPGFGGAEFGTKALEGNELVTEALETEELETEELGAPAIPNPPTAVPPTELFSAIALPAFEAAKSGDAAPPTGTAPAGPPRAKCHSHAAVKFALGGCSGSNPPVTIVVPLPVTSTLLPAASMTGNGHS